MNNLTLKQFRYFDALSRLGHFGHAAAASAISQPALSMQIKEMEETLGAALFERGPRQVRLTSFGEEIAGRIRDVLSTVDEMSDLARVAEKQMVGKLKVGIIPTIAPYLLPKVIRELSETHRDVELHIRETTTPRLIEELLDGRLDCAILALPVSEPSLQELPLFQENFVLVREQSEADKPVPDANALQQMRLLLLEEGHCFRDQALAFCNMQSARPREGLDGSSLSTLVQLVGAGLGVTLIPEMAVPVEASSPSVAVSHFRDPQPSRTIGMIWRKTNPLAKQYEEIAGVVRRMSGG